MIYKERLKDLREREALSQREVGEIIGVDRRSYQHFESEYIAIPIKQLNKVCNYFHVSIDYILGLSDLDSYNNSKKEIDLIESGKRLKSCRIENKLTQKELAEVLKIANTMVSKYEKGEYVISTHALYDFCYEFKISADYILGKINSPKYIKVTGEKYKLEEK